MQVFLNPARAHKTWDTSSKHMSCQQSSDENKCFKKNADEGVLDWCCLKNIAPAENECILSSAGHTDKKKDAEPTALIFVLVHRSLSRVSVSMWPKTSLFLDPYEYRFRRKVFLVTIRGLEIHRSMVSRSAGLGSRHSLVISKLGDKKTCWSAVEQKSACRYCQITWVQKNPCYSSSIVITTSEPFAAESPSIFNRFHCWDSGRKLPPF